MLKESLQKSALDLELSVLQVPIDQRTLKTLQGTSGLVSIADLLAYQIGWGKNLIRWYEEVSQGKIPEMPGEGFATWNYRLIALHFYAKYQEDGGEKQLSFFKEIVRQILKEGKNVETMGFFALARVPSGKKWPLKKWIQVNTIAPYQKAVILIKKKFLNKVKLT